MATKIQSNVSSDVTDIDKCNDEVDPRVQVTFQLYVICRLTVPHSCNV